MNDDWVPLDDECSVRKESLQRLNLRLAPGGCPKAIGAASVDDLFSAASKQDMLPTHMLDLALSQIGLFVRGDPPRLYILPRDIDQTDWLPSVEPLLRSLPPAPRRRLRQRISKRGRSVMRILLELNGLPAQVETARLNGHHTTMWNLGEPRADMMKFVKGSPFVRFSSRQG